MKSSNGQWNILVAADYTDAARFGLRAAVGLARGIGGLLTVVAVESPPDEDGGAATGPGDRERLRRWSEPDLRGVNADFEVRHGLPGIEICRYAEDAGSDLIVAVRKRRTKISRVLSGDTVDSVVRRSVVPCLLVPPEDSPAGGDVVAALDGTERGLVVLRRARRFAELTGRDLATVTVEPVLANEPSALAAKVPMGRSLLLQEAVRSEGSPSGEIPVVIRRGSVVQEVLEEMELRPGSVLVVGYHRGGPPGVIEAGSTSRQLIQRYRGPVLTVPL